VNARANLGGALTSRNAEDMKDRIIETIGNEDGNPMGHWRAMAGMACWLGLMLVDPRGARAGHFEKGEITLGLGVGFEQGEQHSYYALSVSSGYFVLDGVLLGVSGLLQAGSDDSLLCLMAMEAEYIPFPEWTVSPYLAASTGRIFVKEGDDGWRTGIGAGLVYVFHPRYASQMGLQYRWLFFPGLEPMTDLTFNMGFIFFLDR